jgi:antitoxin component of RelBE/YafQ-DinJ toxin-antitoxin module
MMKINTNTVTLKTDTVKARNAAEYLYSNYGYTIDEVMDGIFSFILNKKKLPQELKKTLPYPERYRKLDESFDKTIADYKAGKIKGYRNFEEMNADLSELDENGFTKEEAAEYHRRIKNFEDKKNIITLEPGAWDAYCEQHGI